MIGGGANRHGAPAPYLPEPVAEPCDHRLSRLRRVCALLERLQRDDEEGSIGLRVVVDEVQPDRRGVVRDGGLLLQNVLYLPNDFGCPADRGTVWQLHDTKNAPWSSSGKNQSA